MCSFWPQSPRPLICNAGAAIKCGARHPMGHMGEMSDMVNTIVDLDYAPFVNGEILHVDSGQSAGR